MTSRQIRQSGTVLLVTGLFVTLFSLAADLLLAIESFMARQMGGSLRMVNPGRLFAMCLLLTMASILMVYGGLQMRKTRRYPVALAGAVSCVLVSTIPMVFFDRAPNARLLGIPILALGIWLCRVLLKPQVKSLFGRGSAIA